MSEEPARIGIASRGDVIRAIRQSVADSGVDMNALIRAAIEQAVANRLANFDVARYVESEAKKAVYKEKYSLQQDIARQIASRITLNPEA